MMGLPQLPGSPFRHAAPTTPMDQNGCTCRLLPHPTWAFPVIQAGRRPSLHFRGLLGLHSRCGLPDCSTAQRRPLSRGFDPVGYPAVPLVSYQSLPTTLWVVPSSTGEPRRRGARRVEDGRGGLGHPASPRFPSPLIERSMRISRTTLSDWLHRNAHDEAHDRSRLSGGHRLRIAAELLPTSPGISGVCRLSPITMPSPSSEAHQKSGSFPPPALPGLSSHMTLSDSR